MKLKRREAELEDELEMDPDPEDEIDDADVTEGLPQAIQRVTKWIDKEVHGNAEIQGAVVLDLSRKGNVGQKGVYRWRYHLDGSKAMADEVVRVAEEKIQNEYGRQVFTLRIVNHPVSTQFVLTRPQPSERASNLGDNIYGTGDSDRMSQQLDHNQVLVTRLLQKDDASNHDKRLFIKDLQSEIKRLQDRVAESDRERMHHAAMMKEMILQNWMIEDKREEKRLKRERTDQLFKVGMPLLLTVMGNMAGGGGAAAAMLGGMAQGMGPPSGPPQGPPPGMSPGMPPAPAPNRGPTPIEEVVEMLLSSITVEQFQRIAMTPDLFRPDQIGMLMKLKELVEGRAPEQASETAAPPPPQNGTHEGSFDDEDDKPWTGGFSMTLRRSPA